MLEKQNSLCYNNKACAESAGNIIHTSDERCIGAAKAVFGNCVAMVEKTEGGH